MRLAEKIALKKAKDEAREKARRELAEAAKDVYVLKRQQKALQARDDLLAYIEFTSPDPDDPTDTDKSAYKAARHHKAVAHAIQTFVEGGFSDTDILILVMPPRHGKTEIVSRRLPAWYSGKYPRENLVIASYGDEFAADIGADARRIMQSTQHKQVFPNHTLLRGGTAKDRLQTRDGGLLIFVGRGGALTGRGAHLLICDDLVKSDAEAASLAVRDQTWNWFAKVAMTRRMGRKLAILTFTRWHADDVIGRLTDPENEKYSRTLAERIKIISLPAIAEEDDPLDRAPGEALWPDGPDKFDVAFLEQQRALDPVGFESLYQQRPSAADGVLFRRENIRYYDPGDLPEDLRFYAASDHAVGLKQRNDPSCFLKGGVNKHGHTYLTDCVWKKMPTDMAVEALLLMGGAGDRRPLVWWAERGHISQSIGPFLRKRMLETQTFVNVVEVTPSADKVTRAQSIAARVAMQYVFFPRGATWTEKAIDQMMSFPNGLHDDFVDALALLGLGLRIQVPASAAPPEKKIREGTFAAIKAQQRQADRAQVRGLF